MVKKNMHVNAVIVVICELFVQSNIVSVKITRIFVFGFKASVNAQLPIDINESKRRMGLTREEFYYDMRHDLIIT